MIRVLIADDSPTARALLASILRSDPSFEIVGEARDGNEAVSLTKKLRPGIVTMDLDMPRLDGFAATREIMIESPTPIVVVSAMTPVREAEAAVRALGAGALAVLPKPLGPGSPGFERSARELLDSLRTMAGVKVVRRHRPRTSPRPVEPLPWTAERPRVVAIAASTGGPAALLSVLSGLPAGFPIPLLVVQHIAHGFTPGLASWLQRSCPLRVEVAQAGQAVENGVYVAPDDRHLGLGRDGRAVVSSDPPIGGFRPSATFLFESIAQACGSRSVAVMLTGMGQDGVDGLRPLRAAGGRIIAQDEETSIVFGMPGAVVSEGLADFVLPVQDVAGCLIHLATEGAHARPIAAPPIEPKAPSGS